MAACQACGHANEREANFCSRCGRPTAPQPRGDRRVVTVLFADVSGFTRLSEALDPERLAEIVNACFKALSEPVYRFGGIVDKYIGDAIMALFGAPVAHEDDAERALSAAYAMQRAADRFSDSLEAETGMRFRLRIGINTGLVVAGAIGGDQKRDYTVMGDAVNLAQRLESQAEPGSILVSGQTYRLTSHAFAFQSARKLFVKGREEAVYAYELKGPLLEAQGAGDRPALVGRRRELALLQGALEDAHAGMPQWIMLTGPAGSGKTRLAREAVALLPPDPKRLVIRAQGQTYHADAPFSLIRQILEGLMAPMDDGAPIDRLQAGLEALGLPQPAELCRRLSALLELEEGATASLEALADLFASLSQSLVLLLEDLHRADPDSLRWLAGLPERLGGSVAVICERREPLVLDAAPCLAPLSLSLGALSAEEAWQLVLAELKARPDALDASARPLLEAAVTRSDGNPMFLRELMQGWIESETLKRVSGRWVADPRSGFVLPSSINGILASRLDQLSQPLRELLQAASALEGRFYEELLAEVLGAADIHERVSALLERELLQRDPDGSLGFAQSLVQEVTYQTMLMSQRRELHQRIAEALERRRASISTLARHYGLAGDAVRAVPYLQQAAQRAQARAAHAEAGHFLRQALSLYAPALEDGLPARADLLRSLAESEAVLGHHAEALAAAQEALEALSEPVAIAQTERIIGQIHERLGDYAAAREHYQAAILCAPEPALRAAVQLDAAWLALRQGDHDACLAACSTVLHQGDAGAASLGMAHSLRGVAYDRLGRWQEASAAHREALAIRLRCRDRFGIASSLNNRGMALTEIGAWPEAERDYRRSLRLYERIGDTARASAVRNNLGDLAARRGDLDAAEALHRQALAQREQLGDRFGVGASQCALGWVIALKGDLEEGSKLIRDGVEVLEAIGERELLAEAYQVLGRIALEARRYPEAEVKLAKALGLAHFDRNPLQRAVVHRLRGQLRLELGDMPQARIEIAEALQVLSGLAHPLEHARAQVLWSRLLRAEGQAAEADRVQLQAMEAFERLGARHDLAVLTPDGSPQILCADSPKPRAR